MRGRDLVLLVALTVLICGLFSLVPETEARNAAHLDDQAHILEILKSVPGQLNYQGFLANASDSTGITATLEMTFRLFDTQTKGAELWSETHTMVEVSDGLFQVLLGSMTAFPSGLFDGTQLWLQTEVGPEILTPRKPLVSVAYSQMAEKADHASTANWATDAQHAVHADTAAYSPSTAPWSISGDDVYRETGKVGIGTTTPLTELDVTGSVNAATYYGDGSNLTGISGTTDNDWTISGNDIYSSVSGNVGVGTSSPTAKLDVSGDVNTDSLYKIDGNTVLSTGWKNVSVGIDAGASTGTGCTFVGDRAGHNNQSAWNTFIGSSAGDSNTTGQSNTFVGADAGEKNTEGHSNTFLGVGAGYEHTTGDENTFVGHWAGQRTDGDYNTILGAGAGWGSYTGSNNVFIGWQAGSGNPFGSNNVFIGYSAGSDEEGSSKLIIANGADTSDVLIYGNFTSGDIGLGTMAPAERLHLHKPSGHLGMRISSDAASYQYLNFGADKGYGFGRDPNNKFFLNAEQPLGIGTLRILTATETGYVGIKTSTPTVELDVDGQARVRTLHPGPGTDVVADANGVLFLKSSSRRYKDNIRDLEINPEDALDLQPVWFRWKSSGREDIGLVAEEVEKVAPDLVIHDQQGRPDAVKYDRVTLYLLELAKTQQERIDELEKNLITMNTKLEAHSK